MKMRKDLNEGERKLFKTLEEEVMTKMRRDQRKKRDRDFIMTYK